MRAALTALLMILGLVGSAAQELVPAGRDGQIASFAPVVRRVAPAVVNVYSRRVVRANVSPLFADPLFRQFFGGRLPFGVPQNRVQQSLGSGVILRADGTIVTNNHVIKDADQITVVLNDRREFEAKVVRADEQVDLAILKVDAGSERLPSVELRDSDEVQVGDVVLALGDPFGVGQTVTSGIVSALARTNAGVGDFRFFIQTDAAINPGNSGGALVTSDGLLIGVNTAIFSQSGGSIGIGFAIPSNMVRAFLEAEANGGRIIRPWLGASGQPVTADLATSLGLARPQGVVVNEIIERSPADQAGLKIGDIVTAVNGHEVDDPEGLRYRIATQRIGGTATLTVLRRTERKQLSVQLIAPPETVPRDATLLRGNTQLTGATIANLSPALLDELGLAGPSRGVIVLEIASGSPAEQSGFQPGDVIVRVDGSEIASVAQLRTMVLAGQRLGRIEVRRGNQTLTSNLAR